MTRTGNPRAIRQPNPRTLLSFRQSLRDCTLCSLRDTATSPVPWSGDVGAEIAFVAEAPGATEDKDGQPLIGTSGQRLRQILREVGIDPQACAYLNSCSCWPQRGLDVRNDQFSIDTCRSWMRGQIAFIQPRYVITLGVVAYYSVTQMSWPKLREVHGKPLFWDNPPLPAKPIVWPSYHPAAALRSAKYHKTIKEDLRDFQIWRSAGGPWPEECVICGDELHRYSPWGMAFCRRHAARQMELFPEGVVTGS